MSRLMDSYEELQAEAHHLRRALADADDLLVRWIVGAMIGALAFGLLMFVAGSQCEATRVAMEGLR